MNYLIKENNEKVKKINKRNDKKLIKSKKLNYELSKLK